MRPADVRFLWRDTGAPREFRTGVSLHSHTMHSQENLGFIPRYAAHIPLLAWEIRRQERKYLAKNGRPLDYGRGYWTPPLPGPAAYRVERRQIEDDLGLAALVSLSDHDNIEAGTHLRTLDGTRDLPISVEWTVPVGPTYFHLGVHNLPVRDAPAIVADLVRFTPNPTAGRRRELLEFLGRLPDTLVVLNHPLWDQGGVGAGSHRALLHELLDSSRTHIHAVELNGLRPWGENQETFELARACDRPLVGGGDRHACDPSAVVNLTRATNFPEFVSEVRDGRSTVAFLKRYREPRRFRIIRDICDIMREYPELTARERWSDRVFCHLRCGTVTPLSQVWNGSAPSVVRFFEHTARFIGCAKVQGLLRQGLADSATPARY